MIRELRNFFVIMCIIIGGLIALTFLASAIFVSSVWGLDHISLSLSMMRILYNYSIWSYENFYKIDWGYNNFILAKLLFSLTITYGTTFVLMLVFRQKIIAFEPYKKKESVHGDAKWAEEKDVVKAGMRSKKGMILGKDKGGYFVSGGFQHSLLFAPTGSGKGVGFVIPNLLFWEESCVVHDIKLENHELTSGFRAKKLRQKVYVWAPADVNGKTHCYNPVEWISNKPGQMVDDVQKIANLILKEKEFWTNEARTLFVGVALYLVAVPDRVKSFGEITRTIRSDDVTYHLAVVLDTMGKLIHPVAFMNLASFLNKADKERSGVISTMNASLELWANPLIDTATASSDFNFQNFKKEKTTVYVGLTPDNIARLEPLMQVFYQQATDFMTRKIPNKKEEPYGVMFVMDEFPTLGKMEQFKNGIAYFRGYNVRLFLIIQDTEQLKGTYEEAGMNSFLSNSTYRITFAANNMETANLISQLCGNKTVQQQSMNMPKFLDLNPASRSLHVSEVQRALLLPQEVIQLPRDEQIVLVESSPPIKSKKIKYYEDKFFKKRLLPPISIPTQEPYNPDGGSFAKEEKKVLDDEMKQKIFGDLEKKKKLTEETQDAEDDDEYFNNLFKDLEKNMNKGSEESLEEDFDEEDFDEEEDEDEGKLLEHEEEAHDNDDEDEEIEEDFDEEEEQLEVEIEEEEQKEKQKKGE